MPLSRSAKYYRDNPKAREKKNEYQKRFNKSKKQKKRRSLLNKLNRMFGTYGNGDKLDVSHQRNGSVKLEKQSKNRGNKKNSPGDRKSRG